jgi:hypothetical protein
LEGKDVILRLTNKKRVKTVRTNRRYIIGFELFLLALSLLFIQACGNKNLYKNSQIEVKRKEFYQRQWHISSENYELVKTQRWNLVFYTKASRRKIKVVDTNGVSFSFLNDSIVNLHFKSDSSVQFLTKDYFTYLFGYQADNSVGTSFVFETSSEMVNADIRNITPKFLVLDLIKANLRNVKKTEKYRFCFQADTNKIQR